MKTLKILFIALFIFSTIEVTNAQLCHEAGSLRRSSTKEKIIGDILIRYDLFDEKEQLFGVQYESKILNSVSKTACHEVRLQVSFYNKGEKLMPPETVYLSLWSVSNTYKYSNKSARNLKIIGDGKIISQFETERNTNINIPKQSQREILSAEMDFAQFEKIAQSKNISLILGQTEYKLTDKQISDLHQILELVNRQPNENELFGETEDNSKSL